MKALVVSDVHLEFHNNPVQFIEKIIEQSPDILIIAGDFGLTSDPVTISCLDYLATNLPRVTYVMGNHESYDSSRKKSIEILEGIGGSIQLYENKEDGLFAGATTWFEEDPQTPVDMRHLRDFEKIEELKEDWISFKQWNIDSLLFWSQCSSPIWIMHHAPSIQSCGRRDRLSKFYYTPSMEKIILNRKPKVVIHGHLHDTVDYYIGDTRVISNPYGYKGYHTNPSFKWLTLDTQTMEVE